MRISCIERYCIFPEIRYTLLGSSNSQLSEKELPMVKVMIVDDEGSFCYFVQKNLEFKGGFSVSICTEAVWAVRKITEQMPDIILMDIMMPIKSGIDITAELKNDPALRHIPIVFVTALVKRDELEKHANLLGSSLYISKPATTEHIIEVIFEALRK